MLDQSTRVAILKLHEQGHSLRGIARVMRLSRGAVREVLRAGSAEVPRIERPEVAAPYREAILELYASCKGNLVRVHEELIASGADSSYQALTAFCRRQGIGQEEKKPAGATRSSRARRCSTTPRRTTWRSAVRSAACRPRRSCRVSLAGCSSSSIRGSPASSARCSSTTPPAITTAPASSAWSITATSSCCAAPARRWCRCRRWRRSRAGSSSRSSRTRKATPTARRASRARSGSSSAIFSPAASSSTSRTPIARRASGATR